MFQQEVSIETQLRKSDKRQGLLMFYRIEDDPEITMAFMPLQPEVSVYAFAYKASEIQSIVHKVKEKLIYL